MRDHERDWRDCNVTLNEIKGDKGRHIPPHEHQKSKVLENICTKYMQNKVYGSDKVLKEMKVDISTLNQRSHHIHCQLKN